MAFTDMRKVKFKAYDKVSKKVRDVLYIQWTGTGIRFVDMIGARRQPQSIVLMEYTGVPDKNGVEIYEDYLVHAAGSKIVFQIKFIDGSFCLVPYHTHSRETAENWSTDDGTLKVMPLHLMMKTGGVGGCEVIGTIYDEEGSKGSNMTNKWIAGLIRPACNRKDQLFVGHGGFVTCSADDCPNSDYSDALEKAQQAREQAKFRVLRRTEIPKDAREPTRDATVILGEQIADIIQQDIEQLTRQGEKKT